MPDDRPDYRWLVQRRLRIQQALVDLYDLVGTTEKLTRLNEVQKLRRAFGLLVGAAFSLWRAAFLCHGRAGWSENLTHARTFLEKLLGDNAIGYYQELQTRDWTSGYFLGSARFRLIRVEELLFHRSAPSELTQVTFSGPGYRNRQETWDSLFERLSKCVEELQRVSSQQGDPTMRGERVVQYGFKGQPKRIDAVISRTPMTAEQIAQAARLPVQRVRSHLTYWIRHERFYGFKDGTYYRLQRGPQPGTPDR